jgi:hypothetical protein
MEFRANLCSQAFLSSKDEDNFSFQASRSLWQKIVRSEDIGRIFLRISTEDPPREWIAPLGHPITEDMDMEDTLFIPLWMASQAHPTPFDACGEMVDATVMTTEAFPEATKLTLRVVDSAFYNSDVKGELELALSRIGIVRRHTVIKIPIENLSGFPVEVFVAGTEPADLVLCEGEEVAIEFEEPVDHYSPEPSRPPTPIPPVMDELIPQNTTLFPGEGRVLGSHPGIEPPAWRRGLPIPKNGNI